MSHGGWKSEVVPSCPPGGSVYKAGVGTDHSEVLAGGRELQTVSRVTKPCFWHQPAQPLFETEVEVTPD